MTSWNFRIVDRPQKIDLLHELQPHEIDLILGEGRPRRFPAKSVITYQGEPADHFLLQWSGRARYFYAGTDEKKLILKWITPGNCFGGAALVSGPSTYLVSSEAVQDSVVLEWDRQAIRDLTRRYHRLLENVIRIDLEYVSWYVSAYAALTSQDARGRLASVVVELAKSLGQIGSSGIELDVTNRDLAESANITPYTTSRFMSEWQKSGVIRKRKGKIVLRSPDGLFLHKS